MESSNPSLPVPRRQVSLPVPVRHVTELLEAGIPLTLLLDLAEPTGPHSQALYVDEPGDASWLEPVSR